jgi:hypothetical protein
MSPLEWALVLQVVYFLFTSLLFFWDREMMAAWHKEPVTTVFMSILGLYPVFPLIATLFSLAFYPTPWAFVWLGINVAVLSVTALIQREIFGVVIATISFIILLICLRLARATRENPALTYPFPFNINLFNTPTRQASTHDNGLWFFPLKILLILAAIMIFLLLLRWVIEKLFPAFNASIVLEKIMIAAVSGVVVTAFAYWFFGDPTVATVPGFAAAAGLYLLNRQG